MTFPFIFKYVFFTLYCINQPFKHSSCGEELLSKTTDQNGGFLWKLQHADALLA